MASQLETIGPSCGRERLGVLQLIDSLEIGGAEMMAVNIANELPRDRVRSFICATRSSGPLERRLKGDVKVLSLERRSRCSLTSILKLRRFIKENTITVLHAHSSSLFVGRMVALISPGVKVVWHDHFGGHNETPRGKWPYSALLTGIPAVFSVNHQLQRWASEVAMVKAESVLMIPNFVVPNGREGAAVTLQETRGKRIVCVANLRKVKGHVLLIRAFAQVLKTHPDTELILVGATTDSEARRAIDLEISRGCIGGRVHLLGSVENVRSVLCQCDIGVLSSMSEGLPLALLEYGEAGLAVVATRVGECPDVLGNGQFGVVVAPGDAEELANALDHLLSNPQQARRLAGRFHDHVRDNYSARDAIKRVTEVYDSLNG